MAVLNLATLDKQNEILSKSPTELEGRNFRMLKETIGSTKPLTTAALITGKGYLHNARIANTSTITPTLASLRITLDGVIIFEKIGANLISGSTSALYWFGFEDSSSFAPGAIESFGIKLTVPIKNSNFISSADGMYFVRHPIKFNSSLKIEYGFNGSAGVYGDFLCSYTLV